VAHLVIVLVTILLLGGFFVLTEYETRRGLRFFTQERERLDQRVERIELFFTHVDMSSFLRDEVRHVVSRLGHDIAHITLQSVRVAERLLTRLVMRLRTKNTIDTSTRGSAREFVKTLSDFKGQLKGTHPEIHEI